MSTLMRCVAFGLVTLGGLQSAAVFAGAEDRDGNPIYFEHGAKQSDVQRPNPLGIKPVEPKALDIRRGGTDVANEMMLKGVVADNRASNLTTGSNAITEGSFSGMVGIPVVVQNTGNGVLIQNATIINLQVK
ncbi:MAG TPA: hypothetical protein PLO07_05535 [Rubrivivax sp.]|nr:hypothetical protein [Rubrivivax sp.]